MMQHNLGPSQLAAALCRRASATRLARKARRSRRPPGGGRRRRREARAQQVARGAAAARAPNGAGQMEQNHWLGHKLAGLACCEPPVAIQPRWPLVPLTIKSLKPKVGRPRWPKGERKT